MGNGNPGVYGDEDGEPLEAPLDHVSDDLPWGMRGVVAIRDYSDQYYLQDWERQFLYTSAREILSRGFLTKNFGADSFNLRFESSDTISRGDGHPGAASRPWSTSAAPRRSANPPSTFRRSPRSRACSSTAARTCCTAAGAG